MEIRQLVYFVAVAEKGTITEAAKSLHISQPPVSVQLRLLEEELGCVLFDRNTRHMELTEAGQKFYQRASAILEQFDSAKREMKDIESGVAGTLRLGVVSSLCGGMFLDWLKGFRRDHPKVHFEIQEGNTYQMIEKTRMHQVELAFVRTPFSASDLKRVPILKEDLYVVGKEEFFKDGLNRTVKSIALKELTGIPMILYRRWEPLVTEAFRKQELTPEIFCQCEDARTVISMAEKSMGIGIVPQSIFRDTQDLCGYPIREEEFRSEFFAVYGKQTYVSSATRGFLNYVEKQVGRQMKDNVSRD